MFTTRTRPFFRFLSVSAILPGQSKFASFVSLTSAYNSYLSFWLTSLIGTIIVMPGRAFTVLYSPTVFTRWTFTREHRRILPNQNRQLTKETEVCASSIAKLHSNVNQLQSSILRCFQIRWARGPPFPSFNCDWEGFFDCPWFAIDRYEDFICVNFRRITKEQKFWIIFFIEQNWRQFHLRNPPR